ncbi:MAG: hypothetical protein SF182_01695 [Deltaproteobacteria bacterium]|nr:hypothetical protein [Deltaproteobacteria bacterium]
MRRWCLALALVVASAAGAETSVTAPAFLTGFGEGVLSSQIWTTGAGTPAVSWSGTTSHWGLDLNPADGAAEWIYASASDADQKHVVTLDVRLTTVPAFGCRTVAPFVQVCDVVNERVLGGAALSTNAKQCFVTVGSDRKLRLYFNDADKECTANSLYKYTECATDAECPVDTGGNPGESACAESVFAKSDKLSLSTNHRLAIITDNDPAGARPYDAKCTLYVDGIQRGSKTRREGVCSGGTFNGKACGADSDCGGGTCGASGVFGTPARLILGDSQTTGAKAADIRYEGAALWTNIADTAPLYSKIVHLWPNANSVEAWTVHQGCGGAGNHWNCVKDPTGGNPVDGDTTALYSNTTSETDIYALTDYALGTGETALAAAAKLTGREVNDNANTGKNVVFGLRDSGSNEVLSGTVDFSSYGDVNYATLQAAPTNVPSASGSWAINGIRGVLRYTGTGGTSSDRVRATSLAVDLCVGLQLPAVPNVLPAGADGQKTVAILGDSQMNDPELMEALQALLEEPANVLRCSYGGRTTTDLYEALPYLLEGLTTTRCIGGANVGLTCSTAFDCPGSRCSQMACTVERGASAPVDVAVMLIGANDFSGLQQQQPDGVCFQRGCIGGANAGLVCQVDSECPGGTCTDFAGPQQGSDCGIPSGFKAEGTGSWVSQSYCAYGTGIGACCTTTCGGSSASCTGSTAQKCVGGTTPNYPCTSDANCSGGGTCSGWWGPVDGTTDITDKTWGPGPCVSGSNVSPDCPRGLCVSAVSTAYIAKLFQGMVDIAISKSAKLVFLGSPDPCQDFTTKQCIGGSAHTASCTSDANCAGGGHCARAGAIRIWNNQTDRYRWLNKFLRDLAAETGNGFFDLGGYLYRMSSAREQFDENYRDCIHFSTLGQERGADGIEACLEEDGAVPENLCGNL